MTDAPDPRQRQLTVLQEKIRACTRCADAGYIPVAQPCTDGLASAPFFLIGQAPSRTDGEREGMYLGPAGRKLRSWFIEAGFTDADFGTRIYCGAITKCFPGRLPGSSKDRVPSRAEQKLCRPWLDGEFATVQPSAVILLGGLAIGTFLSRAPLSELIGKSFTGQDGRTYLPLPHSSGASTWLNAEENRARLAQAILRLRELREGLTSGD